MFKSDILIGVDEAGRGALAGPLIVAAVCASAQQLSFCRDSKTISHRQRLIALTMIQRKSMLIGVGWADAWLIDQYGITKALQIAASRALSYFSKLDYGIILDGNYNYIDDRKVCTVVRADSSIKQVAAASIVAKTYRDRYMTNISSLYQEWEFERHKGYGTACHLKHIEKYGTGGIHRLSFKPCQKH